MQRAGSTLAEYGLCALGGFVAAVLILAAAYFLGRPSDHYVAMITDEDAGILKKAGHGGTSWLGIPVYADADGEGAKKCPMCTLRGLPPISSCGPGKDGYMCYSDNACPSGTHYDSDTQLCQGTPYCRPTASYGSTFDKATGLCGYNIGPQD